MLLPDFGFRLVRTPKESGGYRGARHRKRESTDYPAPGGLSSFKVKLFARGFALGAWGTTFLGGNVSRDATIRDPQIWIRRPGVAWTLASRVQLVLELLLYRVYS